jgi:hypothetical protein
VLFKNSVFDTKVTSSVYALAYSNIRVWTSDHRVVSRAKRLQVSAWFHFLSKCKTSSVHSITPWRQTGGGGGQTYSSIHSYSRHQMEAWQIYVHATLRPGREARYLLRRRMSGPTVWKFRKRENLCQCRDSNFGFSSLYPSLYTNYDTPTQGLKL